MAHKKKNVANPSSKKEVEFISVRSPRSSKVGQPLTEPRTLFVISIFALVTVIFFFSHLTGTAFLWEDFAEQFFPFQTYAASSFSAGSIPFWNPYTFSGMPFFADLQNGYFYPGHLLMYLFSGGKLTVWLAQFFIILHYFIAMVGMWKLAGEMKVSGWGRIYAGIAYGLSGMLVVHMIHPNMLYHFALFPLILAYFWKGLNERSLFHTLLAGLILGLVMLSGHPQTALYIIFFLFCTTLFVIIRDLRSDNPEQKRGLPIVIGGAVATVLIAAGIFAVQYLPSQELADRSQRAEMTYEQSIDGSIDAKQLFTLVTPKIFGVVTADPPKDIPFWMRGGGDTYYFWETVIFVGVVTLLLALLGLASGKLRGAGWFFAGMALFGLLYGLGGNAFIHPIIGKLPFLNTFRIPARMAIYFTLGAALLAGVGLDRVIQTEANKERLSKVLMIGGGVIVFIALLGVTSVLLPMLQGAGQPPLPAMMAKALSATAIAPLLISLLAVGIIWFGLKSKLPGIGTAIGLILLCLVDLITFGIEQNTAPTNPDATLSSWEAQFPFAKASPPESIFRVQPRTYGDIPGIVMLRNQGPYSQIMSTEGYNPLLLLRINPPAPTAEETMALLNVKYKIQVDSSTGQILGLGEVPTPYPHAWLTHSYQVISDENQLKSAMESGGTDLAQTVFLETEPSIKPSGSGGTARITAYEPNRIEIATSSNDPSILVLSEIYYPAWKAYVDGEAAELLRADWSLRGVPLQGGDHKVELRFESDAFSTGMTITLLTLLLTLGGLITLYILKKKRGEPDVTKEQDSGEGA